MRTHWITPVVAAFALLAGITSHAQNVPTSFEFLAPQPGASLVPHETSVILRPGGELRQSVQELRGKITVIGSLSGTHAGSVTIATDGETIIFTPDLPFAAGEEVMVEVAPGIITAGYGETGHQSYRFEISKDIAIRKDPVWGRKRLADMMGVDLATVQKGMDALASGRTYRPTEHKNDKSVSSAKPGMIVPDDYPVYDVTALDNPGEGYVFLTPFSWPAANTEPRRPYLLIIDNDGNPVFYKRMEGLCTDLKLQPNGNITYFDNHPFAQIYYEMDPTYTIVDTWFMKNGHGNDLHGIQLLPNGGALLMSYDPQTIDMSQVVEGGKPDAVVEGFVIQEQDSEHNVVFEWRSWDHFEITDASSNIDLTADHIDYVHGNAVELDNDGNIMISSRHMDEVTKIKRETGEIIWRWGGKQNEFTFINDDVGFSHQHDIRRLANGNVSLFDNGNQHDPSRSRAAEYALDEENRTATLVWQYAGESDRFSVAMGNAQRLVNGNTMIGWGYPTEGYRKQAVREVTSDGSIAFELLTDTNVVTYRAFRFKWNGRSSAPYLWTEDEDSTLSTSVRLKMVMFGRDDIAQFEVFQGPTQFPLPDSLIATISDNSILVENLEKGRTYFFRVRGVTDNGDKTEYSQFIRITLLPAGPAIVTSGNVDFGAVGVGTSKTLKLDSLIWNRGDAPMTIEQVSVSGEQGDRFEITSGGNTPITVQPGERHGMSIRFDPQVIGTVTAEVEITSNSVDQSVATVQLQGSGAQMSLSGTDVDMGKVDVGTRKDSSLSAALCNNGEVAIVVQTITIANPAFEVESAEQLPTTLEPGECLTLNVKFAPTEVRMYAGSIVVTSSLPGESYEIEIAGESIGVGALREGSDGPTDFSLLRIGQNTPTHQVEVALDVLNQTALRYDVVELNGRVVLKSEWHNLTKGRHTIAWDGQNAAGNACPSGRYIIHLVSANQQLDLPVLLIR